MGLDTETYTDIVNTFITDLINKSSMGKLNSSHCAHYIHETYTVLLYCSYIQTTLKGHNQDNSY